MKTKPLPKGGYNESKEEAKHPFLLLALVSGVYPAVIIIGLLIAIAYFAIPRGEPKVVPATQTIQTDSNASPVVIPADPEPESKLR